MQPNNIPDDGVEQMNDQTVSVGGRQIQAVTDAENALGWVVYYTVGPNFLVPREWLVTRSQELGLHDSMLPTETSPKRAFTRTSTRLTDEMPANYLPPDVEANVSRVDYSTFNLEIIDRRDGEIDSAIIGQFNYDGGDIYYRLSSSIPEHMEWFRAAQSAFEVLYEDMKMSNMGKDVRKMIREFCTHHSTSVKMRPAGAVYFVPAHYEDELMALKQMLDEINVEFKDHGFSASIDTIEVIDSPAKRELIEAKVRDNLEVAVSGLVEDALDQFSEDQAANAVVSGLGQELASIENLALEHNTLLSAEISVREALETWKSNVRGDNRNLVQQIIDEVDI
jgi:hypothetical protein